MLIEGRSQHHPPLKSGFGQNILSSSIQSILHYEDFVLGELMGKPSSSSLLKLSVEVGTVTHCKPPDSISISSMVFSLC